MRLAGPHVVRVWENKRPRGSRSVWGKIERRKEEKGRDACAGRGEKEKAGPETGVGPEWKKVIFFKNKNLFPNLFSLFSILSQIKIEFEFNFKSTSPTLNQKQYASA